MEPPRPILRALGRRPGLVVATLAALVLFAGLGTGSLRDWDEATYAQVAREMATDGDWITPHEDGQPWYHKPPLYLWVSAAAMRVLGPGELAPRLGAALAGVALTLLVFRFGARAFGWQAGAVAALVLLSTPQVLRTAKMGMLDVPLTAAFTGAVLAWWRAGEDRRWLAAWGAALGLATMIKGLAVAPLLLVFAVHALWAGRLGWLREPRLWAGIGVALLVAAPWHLAQSAVNGADFWREYVGYHVLARASRGIEGNAEGPFFYVRVFLHEARPWFLVTLPALGLALREAVRERRGAPALLAVWALCAFGVPSAMATKLDWYVLPVHPPLALLAGWLFATRVPVSRRRVVGIAVVVLTLASFATTRRAFHPDYSPEAKALGAVAREVVPRGQRMGVVAFNPPAARWYAERPVVVLDPEQPGAIDALLAEQGGLYAFARSSGLASLAPFSPRVEARAGDRVLVRLHARSSGP